MRWQERSHRFPCVANVQMQASTPKQSQHRHRATNYRGSTRAPHIDILSMKAGLVASRSPPKDTLFENDLFENTLQSTRGRNEIRVIRDIAQLIVSAEVPAIRGSKHLESLREATNAGGTTPLGFY
ncbi:hypothetical protein GGS24DRAFT_124522 [Hypoxylon argillaceum]|nr:hypothetical protein GGS24DRAFT_124522 [Hypoxylon argillaceum]KAI1147572.1 hypothetical protein F4825DRAFT_136746 [Nemania diffusa]